MGHRPAGVQPTRAHRRAVQLCQRIGAGLVEYVLLIALIAVGLVMIVTQFRNATGGRFNQTNDALVTSTSNSFGSSSGNGNGNGNGNSGNSNGNNGNQGQGNQGNGNGNR